MESTAKSPRISANLPRSSASPLISKRDPDEIIDEYTRKDFQFILSPHPYCVIPSQFFAIALDRAQRRAGNAAQETVLLTIDSIDGRPILSVARR